MGSIPLSSGSLFRALLRRVVIPPPSPPPKTSVPMQSSEHGCHLSHSVLPFFPQVAAARHTPEMIGIILHHTITHLVIVRDLSCTGSDFGSIDEALPSCHFLGIMALLCDSPSTKELSVPSAMPSCPVPWWLPGVSVWR